MKHNLDEAERISLCAHGSTLTTYNNNWVKVLDTTSLAQLAEFKLDFDADKVFLYGTTSLAMFVCDKEVIFYDLAARNVCAALGFESKLFSVMACSQFFFVQLEH